MFIAIFQQLMGVNRNYIPEHMAGVIFTHEFGGASTNNVMHWIQSFRKKKFERFCYGEKRNLEIYGQENPPEYCHKHLKSVEF